MRSISRRRFVAGLLATPVLAACGGGDDDESSDTTERDTTTSSTSTTPSVPVQPLTGVVHNGDPAILTRPAVVVKIDNADARNTARPQAGLNQADVVYEERVEGSVTRLATVFHSQDADPVGPIRSFRTSDLAVVGNLNFPLLAWSGANAGFAAIAREGPLVDVGYDVASDAYYRDPNRRAPQNLMSSTPALRGYTPAGAGPPPPLFTYRAPGTPAAGGRPVSDVLVSYGGQAGDAPVNYRVDSATGTWLRFQRGTPHVDEAGVQVQPENVVIMHVEYVDTGATDTSGAAVPEAQLVGSGVLWVLTGGMLVEGTWTRPSLDAVATLLDSSGAPIALTPGRTWIALPSPGGASVVA